MQDALKKMDAPTMCYRKGDTWKEERSKYAWSLNPDKDMLATFTGEGDWDEKKRSYIKGANGHYDYGICQINDGYHPEIVHDKRFKDWKWQLEQCVKLYKGGTTFYAYRNRAKFKPLITCQ